MPIRELYLVDETRGRVTRRWPVDGMSETEIRKLECEILAHMGDDVVLRDSKFDRAAAPDHRCRSDGAGTGSI